MTDSGDLSFSDVLRWLDARIGQEVFVSFSTPHINSDLTSTGRLGLGDFEKGLINSRGPVHQYVVGTAQLALLEEDFRSALPFPDTSSLHVTLGDLVLLCWDRTEDPPEPGAPVVA